MPIYEYQCEKCEHEFQREQRITADPVKTCPKCKARRVKKLISRTSFVLKGGGWYGDLYSSSKKESTSDSGDSKTDSKSESSKKPKKDSTDSGDKSSKKKKKKSSKNAA